MPNFQSKYEALLEENVDLNNKIDDLEVLRDKLQGEAEDLNEEIRELNQKLKDISDYAGAIKSSVADIEYECK